MSLPRSLRMDTEEDRKADRKAARASAKVSKPPGRMARALDTLKMFGETMVPNSKQWQHQKDWEANKKAAAKRRREDAARGRSNADSIRGGGGRRKNYDQVED